MVPTAPFLQWGAAEALISKEVTEHWQAFWGLVFSAVDCFPLCPFLSI